MGFATNRSEEHLLKTVSLCKQPWRFKIAAWNIHIITVLLMKDNCSSGTSEQHLSEY